MHPKPVDLLSRIKNISLAITAFISAIASIGVAFVFIFGIYSSYLKINATAEKQEYISTRVDALIVDQSKQHAREDQQIQGISDDLSEIKFNLHIPQRIADNSK